MPCRPVLVNHASGTPSDVDWSSPPCRWTTVGSGPVYGPKDIAEPSGLAQWIVWLTVRYLRSAELAGRLFTYFTVTGVPRCTSTVAPGHCGVAPAPVPTA